MKSAASATRRGRALHDEAFPADFVCNAYMLTLRRAARDAHRTMCDRDAVDCDICRDRACAIADAKWALNHRTG